MGSYDNGIYQPIFSIVSKNANRDQKEAFIRVIEETLQSIVKTEWIKNLWRQGSTITSSASERQIWKLSKGTDVRTADHGQLAV